MEPKPQNTTICLAVLPLQILSDNPEVDMFCSGLIMDLITDLSRFRSIQIISYNTIKEHQPDDSSYESLIDKWQLDYLVTGMVRVQKNNLVFNIQLLQAEQNRVVWAEKFRGSIEEIFRIQEDIVEKIVGSLQHFVDLDLVSEIRRKPVTNLSAYECWLKGYREIKKGTIESDDVARKYFKQAIDIDPEYARAYTGMSLTYFNEWSCQLWNRWEISRKGAFEWAQKAVDLDEMDYISTAILGRVYLFKEEFDTAEHYLRKALHLNPNDAENLFFISFNFVYLGYYEEANKLYLKAQRLNPAMDESYYSYGTFIHLELGNYEESIAYGEKMPKGKGWVDFPAFLAASYFHLEIKDKMWEMWNIFLERFSEKINNGNPTDTETAIQWMKDINPYKSETKLQPFWKYMLKADNQEIDASTSNTSSPTATNEFFFQAGLWTFTYENQTANAPDLKGYHDIKKLLEKPDSSIHCTELMGAQLLESGVEVIDSKAKANYKQKILDIQHSLDEAEFHHKEEEVAVLQEEYDKLLDHLSKSTGLGGKTRKTASGVEKSRTAVTWRIRSAIKRLLEIHPSLGKHLEVSLKTGNFCKYSPEKEIRWNK